jgi:hypothetical protein
LICTTNQPQRGPKLGSSFSRDERRRLQEIPHMLRLIGLAWRGEDPGNRIARIFFANL